jgi:hypothetical protein
LGSTSSTFIALPFTLSQYLVDHLRASLLVFCDHLFEIDLWSHLHDPAHAGKATFGNGLGLNIGATYKMVQKA